MRRRRLLWLGALAAALQSCAAPPQRPAAPMVCPHIPPPPKAEVTPPVQKSGFAQILRPGHWDWPPEPATGLGGKDYTWVPARWLTLLTDARPHWHNGVWRQNGGACVWIKPHFAMPGNAEPQTGF